jgi:hypothetical protein
VDRKAAAKTKAPHWGPNTGLMKRLRRGRAYQAPGGRGADSLRNTNPAAINVSAVPATTTASMPVKGSVPLALAVELLVLAAAEPVGPLDPLDPLDPLVSVPCTWDCGSY